MVTWIVEHFGLNHGEKLLQEEISKQGHWLLNACGKTEMYGESTIPKIDGPVVVMGSIQFCGYIQRKRHDLASGVYMSMDEYDCTKYYPLFGDKLLNSDYCMLPFGELCRRKEWLYDTFGVDRAVFIRPNRGNKIFTGQIVHKENWDKDVERLGFYEVQPHELCVVARPKPLGTESRFVVVNGKVIAGSDYRGMNNAFLGDQPVPLGFNDGMFKVAQEMVNKSAYKPDVCWVLDTTFDKEADAYKVLETGAFSCCGIYGCDPAAIVEHVSLACEREYSANN
jgi:hypothetical protein